MLHKNSRYAAADGFTVRNFIREYRFVIDDFQPDELRLIKLDFNARMQIAYERDGNIWYVYRGTDNRWEENPIDTLLKSPVQKDGLFIFRPKDVFNRGIADKKDSILLSAIQEDGANCVSVYVVNKVGNANSQQIHFKFQAVDYLIEEDWPKSFETVSRMDSASIYSNDLGYGTSLGKYRLIVLGPKNKDTVDVFVDSLEGAGARYRFRADLSSVWSKHPLENSTYTLKWDLGFQVKTLKADYATGEQNISYNPQTIVFGDNSAPKLVFDTTLDPKAVSVKRDEALARVINLDSAENRSLRGLRSFMVRRETMDTVWLLHRAHVSESFYEIGWNGNFVPWSGQADLYVQAYDFANPDGSLKEDLVHVVSDSAKSSWSLVMQNDTSFKPGINGISLHREILVDGEAPLPTGDSVTVCGFADSSLPPFSRNAPEIFLNANDTLVVSFTIDEDLFSRSSESISVELVFEDSSDNGKINRKRFLSDFTIGKFSKRFVFEEPEANRLEDGIYSLTVILTDEAGNRSEKRILEKLRVDRTSPQIRGISLGDVAYENAAELKKGTAHLSQSGDDSRNRSDLACYVKVDVNDKKGGWIGPVAETESRNTLNSNIEFDIKNASSDSSDGIRYVYFGCYDDVGNFGKNVNLVGIGARYPKITFPKSGSGFYSNRILVKGFAPNPDIRGNNSRGEFRVSWRKQGDSLWSENGIRYLVFDRSLSPSERDLAVWNSAGLEKGEYVLRLSARSCDTCKWVSDEKTVPVDDFVQPDSAKAPKLVIVPSVGKHLAGQPKDVSIELKNVPDTSKWVVSASIEAPSPKDSSVYVKAVEKTFDPMTISPFKTPATASDSGLSIWQEADGVTWHVRYAGNTLSVTGLDSADADSSTVRRKPYLAIRFVGDSIDWNSTPVADSSVALGFVMDSVKIKNEFMDVVMPPYDEIKMWKVGSDSVHLVFKTAAPFTVDASLAGGILYRDSLSVVYVYPEKYKAHIAWDGLVNGIYSSGSLVRMNVIAYEKENERNIISEEAEWFLEYGNTEIEISSDNLEKYDVNFLGSSADSSEAKTADYGFRFKLTGRSAYVTAEVLDSSRHVVRTLMDKELVLATSRNQWKTLQWNGVKNDGLLQPGPYCIHLLVKNDTGATLIDTLYPFEMNLGENIREAGMDSLGRTAKLRMDEAFLDPDGNLRYVGKPDYLLKTNVSATTLPEDRRTFRYEWDVYGTQRPAMYRKTRPSLGIRRHRDEFWATVVTLVMSESRKYQISYSGWDKVCYQTGKQESRGYWYRINVKKIQFKENTKNQEISVDLHPENGTSGKVYGYLNNRHDDSPEILHNLTAIKILPASSYDHIKKALGNTTYFSNAVWDGGFSVSDDFPWDTVYKEEAYSSKQFLQMKNWFDNWGQALYYEAVNTDFRITTNSDSLNNAIHKDSSTRTQCESDDINASLSENGANFVCGAKNAYEETDSGLVRQFNPHAYMLNVKLKPFDKEESFVIKKFDKNDCSEMDGSGNDIKVKFVLEMNPDYWNPPVWGTNNLANRYVRFDPVNKTLYGADGYVSKLQNLSDHDFANFYDGSNWIFDASSNNGPTVFEAQRLWMHPVPENPLLFNDEIHAEDPNYDSAVVKHYPSEYSWRFYRGSGDVTYKAEARNTGGNLLASFRSDEPDAVKGKDKTIGVLAKPRDFYFDVAPVMTFDEARNAGIALETKNSVAYPLGNGICAVEEPTEFRFYGCDRWVSHVHLNKHDWNDSLWKSTFALANGNGYIRNPLTDAKLNSLTNLVGPQNDTESNESLKHVVSPNDWRAKDVAWTFTLKKTASEMDELFGKISIGKYVLKSDEDKSSGWEIDSSKSESGIFTVANKGTLKSSTLDFYRSKDSLYRSEKSLNNGQQQESVPLSSVVAQSTNPADTILVSEWAKNPSAEVVGIFKRNMSGDASPIIHPYLDAAYDSVAQRFAVTRNSSDIYASRENEIVTLRGRVPYRTADWNISYIQDGMRFKVAEGKQEPIEASMNVNGLQGNTSFFLTYNGTGDITYYRQLDVRIGERVKADKETFVYSMYGNVSVHFDRNAWASDADVTVRTMDPAECGDCDLFRNMAPVGPVLEILPSHVFPEDKEPLVSVDISMQSLKKDGVDYRNLKIYKLDADKKELVPLEIQGDVALLDSELNLCEADEPYSCAFVRINAKTRTFSKFVVLDSLTADSVKTADSIPGAIESFSCSQMDSLWMDTLWMGTANGWLEFPYLCTGKSNYLLQLGTGGDISAEHRGASASPIVWIVRNTDLNILDSAYRSSVVFYGIDGNTEQKLGPLVKLDSVAPVIQSVETAVSENEDGSRVIHVEAEIDEAGSGLAQTTVELFFGGSLLRSETVPGNLAPICDFRLDAKDLYGCVGCRASIKVIVSDKGHNSDMAVRQTERLYPYPSSLVLWYPFGEGSGDVGYEIMTKDDSRRMHMDLSSVNSPWNGRYGVHLYRVTDSASSRFKLAGLDSLLPFTFEFNYNAGNVQRTDWSILSFVGKNEWIFGLGTYNRYFLQVGSERFYFNMKREAYIPTHFAVVVDGKNATLYKNSKYAETITLGSELKYGGNGRLSIGTRNGLRSAMGQISNLRLYSSALSDKQIQGLFSGTLGGENIRLATVRAVSLADRNGLTVDQSCSAPGKAYLRQKSASDNGVMT